MIIDAIHKVSLLGIYSCPLKIITDYEFKNKNPF